MTTETPFFLSKVECPICKTINEYETVRVGAYVEEGRDSDFCPREIKWRFQKYDGYNPLVFFVATCSNCYYSREFTPAYKDWKRDNNFRTYRLKAIKDKHLDQLATADSFVKRLGDAIDIPRNPNKSAILKLHLAAFDELLFEHHSLLDLGRYYLRIAWVFRDMESGENPQKIRLRGMLYDLEAKCDQMVDAVKQAREKAGDFSTTMQAQFEEDTVTAELKAQMMPYRERFDGELGRVGERLDQLDLQIGSLAGLIDEFRSVGMGLDAAGASDGFAGFASFEEFLLDARHLWDGIVTTEHEALIKAVKYYRQAFTEGRGIAPGNQQIQASYLIAELSRRIGDYETAREYFNATIKHGQEFIYRNRDDKSQTALARKILELAIEQGKTNMQALQTA